LTIVVVVKLLGGIFRALFVLILVMMLVHIALPIFGVGHAPTPP
jgi:hypothetical protein